MTSLLGIDFTSAPRRAKPITVAHGRLDGARVVLDDIERCSDWTSFEAVLARPGAWLGAFDFPFGLPREAVIDLGWPQTWQELVRHCAAHGQARLPRGARRLPRNPPRRPPLRAPRHRPARAFAQPVEAGQSAGRPDVPRGRAAPARGRRPCARECTRAIAPRVAIEAYPGLLARRITPASYKSDERRKQTPERRAARAAIVDALVRGAPSSGGPQPRAQHCTPRRHSARPWSRTPAATCSTPCSPCCRPRRPPPGSTALRPAGGLDPIEGWIAGCSVASNASATVSDRLLSEAGCAGGR